MSAVDGLILFAVVAIGALGWFEGLVRALWGYTGLLLGAAAGLLLAPVVLRDLGLSVWVAMAALGLVLGSAFAVRTLAVRISRRLRARIEWEPRPWLDRPGGLIFGVVATLGVSWMLGLALAGSNIETVAAASNRSVVLRALNEAPLPWSNRVAAQLSTLGSQADFPRYVDLFTAVEIVPVSRPPAEVADEPAMRRAAESVWKVFAKGDALTEQGTAFLVAPERVMTAGHVVGDSTSISVETPTGPLDATILVCDAENDVAVLGVPGLDGQPLDFTDGTTGDPAAVVGYPDNGPLTITPARIRARQPWQSRDIWGDGRYEHDAYSVRTKVQGGNSGGPLITPQGRVLGVVVASSRVDDHTGYVLTRDQVGAVLERSKRTTPDASGSCRP